MSRTDRASAGTAATGASGPVGGTSDVGDTSELGTSSVDLSVEMGEAPVPTSMSTLLEDRVTDVPATVAEVSGSGPADDLISVLVARTPPLTTSRAPRAKAP